MKLQPAAAGERASDSWLRYSPGAHLPAAL